MSGNCVRLSVHAFCYIAGLSVADGGSDHNGNEPHRFPCCPIFTQCVPIIPFCLPNPSVYVAAAICLMIWDHLLTVDQEVDAIWISRNKGCLPKVIYVLNRYFAEGVLFLFPASCTRVLWLFTMSSTVMVGLLQFIIAMRVYRSWDNQKRAGYILLVALSVCISVAFILAVITVIILLKSKAVLYLGQRLGNVCYILDDLPRTVPALLATLLAFDILIVLMVLYRALEKPRRTHIEAINSFHRDGARLYLVHIYSAAWALNTNIGCRVHLRVEGLKFLVGSEVPLLLYRNADDFELYYR
ncbi:uncharacterized protein EV420DRAFT_1575737 [Desarmillaria tabescens]|uniref:DUF6533 domain-containing protein n=1 Tax=Armillaria tabescens TaxID=1929756 RepID=A0AA39JKM2_ARMTA|nr:uncharacterized protein EV420DRAFT_1575737 [Desarmillaria tabescens]KAK0443967.1 hypothetical protein EV420DRAFT_1575737 [Desarmillaria tabescens]